MSQSDQPSSQTRELEALFADFTLDANSPHDAQVQRAVYLARILQQRATALQTPQEKRQQSELDRMIQSPRDKATLTQLTDQAFRARVPQRIVDQLIHILDVQGIPRFFSPIDRTLLKGFQSFGSYLPGVAVPLVKEKMHQETANVILPAERDMLTPHLEQRRLEGVRMNVNYLGEALLGEQEARRRLKAYLEALQYPEIEVISVKISTIFSQISSLARRHTISVLCDRLEHLYRDAAKMRFRRADGVEVAKFVYLDMEEYRDMSITADVFMQTLDRPGLEHAAAGIALQAYIPDSYRTQKRINAWARKRVAAGGAPVTIRVVKGANMEMERVEASLSGWPQATYKSKLETDANYKRMIHEGLRQENLEAVRLAIASHNLFDVAYGLVRAMDSTAPESVHFEMLEGMANHQRRALFEWNQNLLLYAPASTRENFINAIGYLIRRLDENTGPDNFLRHAFKLRVDTPDWARLEQGFLQSFDMIPSLSDKPRRQQDRNETGIQHDMSGQTFVNEPDTDFSLQVNSEWAEKIVEHWRGRCDQAAPDLPLVIDGDEILDGRKVRESQDPSRPGVCVARYRQANSDDVVRAVACARRDEDGWRKLGDDARGKIMMRVAHQIRSARADLIGAAMADGGKTIAESDPEVSEAIDFVEFYPRTAASFARLSGLLTHGLGVVAVVSPWNFPIAIPCGGIAAALSAGNTVILKPASDTVLVAHELCQCFWRAGVSKRTLQFLPCSGNQEGTQLVAHQDVDVVVLTGGNETALAMLAHKTEMNLLAETGGKNATIVTALADRDQAIKNVIRSAFGHSGQKCSATSLLVLEEEVYHDPRFREAFCDAVRSLPVGSAWSLPTRLGPLIRPPTGALERGLKELEPGESWAVLPEKDKHNSALYSPGVKWGVRAGSFTHMVELFGPVLGVLKAKNLDEAIQLVNQTGYGLTSSLESLDDREQALWVDTIKAGNLYVNRSSTGAVVFRQPFGGMGKSAFGPGIKAGGPNYVAPLMVFQDGQGLPHLHEIVEPSLAELSQELQNSLQDSDEIIGKQVRRVIAAIGSYSFWAREEFGVSHDHFRLIGQDNLRRYHAVQELRIRVDREDSFFDLFARVCAAKSVGSRITVSIPPEFHSVHVDWLDALTEGWAGSIEFVEETDDVLAEVLRAHQTDRLRYAHRSRVPPVIWETVAESGLYVAHAPVLGEGRIELLWYVREQSVCIDYHRYGNLGIRDSEPRTDTA